MGKDRSNSVPSESPKYVYKIRTHFTASINPRMFSPESVSLFPLSVCMYMFYMSEAGNRSCLTFSPTLYRSSLKCTINIELEPLQKPVCLLCAQ